MQGYTQTDTTGPDGSWSKDETCPRSKVWVIFENGRAYPKYLVRYYRGDRDARRTQFETREHAGVTGSMARRHSDRQQHVAPAQGHGAGGAANPVHNAGAGGALARLQPRPQQPQPQPRRPQRAPPVLPGPRAAAPTPAPAALWVVASQGLIPGAGTMEINGVQTPNVIGMADASQVEGAWQRGRESIEYVGSNGQPYVLTFADFIQRNRETGNPSQVHRLVNGNDSTWYAKALRPTDQPGPSGERHYYVEHRTGRTVWTPNRLCPAVPLSPARAMLSPTRVPAAAARGSPARAPAAAARGLPPAVAGLRAGPAPVTLRL